MQKQSDELQAEIEQLQQKMLLDAAASNNRDQSDQSDEEVIPS